MRHKILFLAFLVFSNEILLNNAIKRNYPSLTPISNSASYTNENKRMAEDIIIAVNQGKIHVMDELKRLQAEILSTDQTLKTEILMDKTETANNLKRHSGNILYHLNSLTSWLSAEIPKVKLLVNTNYEATSDVLANIQSALLDITNMNKEFQTWKKDVGDDVNLKFNKIIAILEMIHRNTDFGNTDSTSLGSQIHDLIDTVDAVAISIGAIDKRLPGIDSNGDGIIRSLQTNFDSLNLKLEGFTKVSTNINTITKRLEDVLSKMSHQSYPENDNHMPNAGSIPNVYTGVPNSFQFKASTEDN
uniref:Uncharacterized protein n=1 Tax=Drosophila-associated filamentous virus TaxID=2743186 RepID=A0A6M9U067_9VIRU|nr:putative protein 51 [Drosophila-associated filamentous virus]